MSNFNPEVDDEVPVPAPDPQEEQVGEVFRMFQEEEEEEVGEEDLGDAENRQALMELEAAARRDAAARANRTAIVLGLDVPAGMSEEEAVQDAADRANRTAIILQGTKGAGWQN